MRVKAKLPRVRSPDSLLYEGGEKEGEKMEELKRIAILKGIPESEMVKPDCVKYLRLCLRLEKNTQPCFFDDRAEVNDDNTYYTEE